MFVLLLLAEPPMFGFRGDECRVLAELAADPNPTKQLVAGGFTSSYASSWARFSVWQRFDGVPDGVLLLTAGFAANSLQVMYKRWALYRKPHVHHASSHPI